MNDYLCQGANRIIFFLYHLISCYQKILELINNIKICTETKNDLSIDDNCLFEISTERNVDFYQYFLLRILKTVDISKITTFRPYLTPKINSVD